MVIYDQYLIDLLQISCPEEASEEIYDVIHTDIDYPWIK